jgi:hypothetical protein
VEMHASVVERDGQLIWRIERTDSEGRKTVEERPYDPKSDPFGPDNPSKMVDETTRMRFRGVFCHPIQGCPGSSTVRPRGPLINPAGPDGDRPTPASVAGSGTSPGPGAVTDPNPDDIGRGAGGSSAPPDPCRYAKGPGCTDTEPQGTGTGGPTR